MSIAKIGFTFAKKHLKSLRSLKKAGKGLKKTGKAIIKPFAKLHELQGSKAPNGSKMDKFYTISLLGLTGGELGLVGKMMYDGYNSDNAKTQDEADKYRLNFSSDTDGAVGAVGGWILGGPIGALVGGLAGYFGEQDVVVGLIDPNVHETRKQYNATQAKAQQPEQPEQNGQKVQEFIDSLKNKPQQDTASVEQPADTTVTDSVATDSITQVPQDTTQVQQPADSVVTDSVATDSITQVPQDTTQVQTPADTTAQVTPQDTTQVQTPADTTAQVTPQDTTQVQTPADTTAQVTPQDTTQVQTPADTTAQVAPQDTTQVQTPADTTQVQQQQEQQVEQTEQTGETEQAEEEQQATPEYEVKKGDCVWNIAKADLINKYKEEYKQQHPDVTDEDIPAFKPLNKDILARTKELMQINNLQFEPDNYHVMIVPGQKLKLAA